MWVAALLLVVAHLGQTYAASRCLFLVTIPNGWLRYTDSENCNQVGGGVIFYCDKGFELVGKSSTECLASGTWKDPPPKCVDKRCPHIQGIQDGTMSNYCKLPGCKPSFKCDPDWKLDGAATITCQNGAWSPAVPTCKPNWCPLIKTFKNGNVLGYKNPPVVGTKVTVTCDTGFKLFGLEMVTCLPNLYWSGDLGTCECHDQTLCNKAKFNCPRIISTPFSTQTGTGVKPGSWVTITSCNTGYIFPNRASKGVRCDNGKFAYIPECKYHRCPHWEAIMGGTVTQTTKYSLNDKVSFTCEDRFTRVGSPGLQCKETMQWGPGSVMCKEMVCPDILTFKNGKVKNYDNILHQVIQFVCDPGFKLKGWEFARCACQPGKPPGWNTEPPKCVPCAECDDIDLVFAVDTSGSIDKTEFDQIRDFLKKVIDNLLIGPDKARVALINFCDDATFEFKLQDELDGEDAKMAIDKMVRKTGLTFTHLALKEIAEECMKNERTVNSVKIPCVGIVVTDAHSTNRQATKTQAQLTQEKATLIAVGVGQNLPTLALQELRDIASGPDDENVFTAEKATDLAAQVSEITEAACAECDDIDLVFAVDSSGSIREDEFKKIITFVENVIENLDIGQSKARVALINYGSEPTFEFKLKDHDNGLTAKADAAGTVQKHGGSYTDKALVKVAEECMQNERTVNGVKIPCVGIVVSDGKSTDPAATKAQAALTRQKATLIAIGVGNISPSAQQELRDIATGSGDENVFTADNGADLLNQVAQITASACVETVCDDIDLVFATDASGSIGVPEYKEILDFVQDIIGSLDIGQNKARVAHVNYGTTANLEFGLTKYNNGDAAKQDVASTVKTAQGSGTSTDLALIEIGKECMKNERIVNDVKVPCVGIVISDGLSSRPSNTKVQAELAQQKAFLVAVGIGSLSAAAVTELQNIATGSGNDNVFRVDQANDPKKKKVPTATLR